MVSRRLLCGAVVLAMSGCIQATDYIDCGDGGCAELDAAPAAPDAVSMLDGSRQEMEFGRPMSDGAAVPLDATMTQADAADGAAADAVVDAALQPVLDAVVVDAAVMDAAVDAAVDAGPEPHEPGLSPMHCGIGRSHACVIRETQIAQRGRVDVIEVPMGLRELKFGESDVALWHDYAVIGSKGPGGPMGYGYAHVFPIAPDGRPGPGIQLQPDDVGGMGLKEFGASVAGYGDEIWVGAPKASGKGRVYRWVREADGQWGYAGALSPPGNAGKDFGKDIALWGDLALVGAPGEASPEEKSGRVFLYRRGPDGEWTPLAIRSPGERRTKDKFGESVALGPRWAAIGARDVEGQDGNDNKGAAYVFEHSAELEFNLDRVWNPHDDESRDFGRSLALSYGRLVVGGDQGALYVYELDNLRAGCAGILKDPNPEQSEDFSGVVAIEGGTVVTSDIGDGGRLLKYGRISSAQRWTHSTEILQHEINPEVPMVDGSNRFGEQIALFGGRLLVVGRAPMMRRYAYLFDYSGPICNADGACQCRPGRQGVGASCIDHDALLVTGLRLRDRDAPEGERILCDLGRHQIIDEDALDAGELEILASTTDSVGSLWFDWMGQEPGFTEENQRPFVYPSSRDRWTPSDRANEVLTLTPRGPGAMGNEAVRVPLVVRD